MESKNRIADELGEFMENQWELSFKFFKTLKKTCCNCKWWDCLGGKDVKANCMFNPPVLGDFQEGETIMTTGTWPTTLSCNYCEKFDWEESFYS